jgi:uncharacterized protein (TIGR02284 family)
MSNLMTSAVGPNDPAAQLAARRPLSKAASVAESSARLKLDHEEFEASLERLRAFALAEDAELVQGEWNELERSILRHVDAEDMFLLPGFARDQPDVAGTLHAEHAEIRKQLGEVGLALDLHTLRLEQIDALYRAVARHVALEERTLYPWADQERNSPLVDAVVRRLPHAGPDSTREARTAMTLLALLRVCRDGEQGYRRAALDAGDVEHQAVFARLADTRGRFARQLRDELKNLGVSAQFKGTVFGALHRGWIETTSKLAHGKPKMILRECERGEELALRAYRTALRTDLPPSIRGYVQAQCAELDHALKDVRALSATAP